jgi:hypothetical protein
VTRKAPLRPHAFLIAVLAALVSFAGGRGSVDVENQLSARAQEFIDGAGAVSPGQAALLTRRWERETELRNAKRSSDGPVLADGAGLAVRTPSPAAASDIVIELAANPDRLGGILRRGPPLPIA